ncbi:MAG: RNA methyltransferase [Thermoanaerobaculaceae bacterium]|nr:RNA methyltransferase [Thermoanaerobaculaceae bacterium]
MGATRSATSGPKPQPGRQRSPSSQPDPATPPLGTHNPRLTRLRRLVRREDLSLTVVDGSKLVLELADAGAPIEELYATSEQHAVADRHPRLRALHGAGRCHVVTEAALDSVAPTRQSQGLLAVVRVPTWTVETRGIVLYLDGVQDPGNLGALVRCAAALGATGVACSPGCADPFAPRAVRGAAGQSLLFPVVVDVEFGPLAAAFVAAGGSVATTVGQGGQRLADWRPRLPLLIAVGNEGHGIRPEVMAAGTESVSIPLDRGVESLNVAVTAGILLAALGGVAPAPILERGDKKRRAT